MARPLVPALTTAMNGEVRQPAFQVEIYDIRSTASEIDPDTINDVVLFNLGLGGGLQPIVGPRDFTDDIATVEVTEVAGDYVNTGVASSQIIVTIIDEDGSLDPVSNPPTGIDPEAAGRWLRQGNVIVVREGEETVPVNEWPTTFTGEIQGQPGQNRNRTTGQSTLTVKAASREIDFLRQQNVSQNFPQNTTYQSMANDLAEVDMGLDLDEINLPTFSVLLTPFTSTQFVDESPLVSIAKIMFPDGFMPRFEGDGRLGATDGDITKGPARFYPAAGLQIEITRPMTEADGPNEVEVIGLDPSMTEVLQQRQLLARASITTGFFSSAAAIDVQWSEDKTQQARDVVMEVDASVGDGIFNFGTEAFTDIPNPDDGGSVEGRIDVDGALAASLILAGLVGGAWIAESQIPDDVVVFGAGASEGITIPYGRVIQSLTGQTMFTILGTQGRGQYRIMGRPYEYVFKEIRSVTRVAGLRSEDVEPISIENHLINSQANADTASGRVFARERAKQNVRQVRMIHDLTLEPDDVFEVGEGVAARRYMIANIQRRLQRGGTHEATMNCFEVTPGVRP